MRSSANGVQASCGTTKQVSRCPSLYFFDSLLMSRLAFSVTLTRLTILNSLKKDGDCFTTALGPDERTGFNAHLRRHDVLYLAGS